MQKLHVVGLTPDRDGLILSTRKGAKSGGFVVPIDAATLERLADESRAPAAVEPAARANGRKEARDPRSARPESQLGPREMQELLRGGWTLEEVAVEAGVDVDWVSRFAAPVLAEMNRVLDRAQACTFEKPRVGVSALPLGPSVRRNVAERGIRFTDEEFDDSWRAAQLHDDLWLIGFDYTSRGRAQEAEWILDLELGELTSNNRLGTQLGYVQSARRKIDTSPPPKPKPKAARVTAKAPGRARSRASAGGAKKAAAKRGSARAKSKPHEATDTETPTVLRRDPWREELKRRELERSAALAERMAREREAALAPAAMRAPAPVAAPADVPAVAVRPRPEPIAPAPAAPPPPVAIIGPTVRTLRRNRPVAEPDEIHVKGPLPAPAPIALPEESRERASHPLGSVEDDEDVVEVEELEDVALEDDDEQPDDEQPDDEPEPEPVPEVGLVAPAGHAAPVFHGARTASFAPAVATPARRRPRSEPLRAR